LSQQNEEVKAVLSPMYGAIAEVAKERGFSLEGLMAAVANNTAREMMETVHLSENIIREIDAVLHGMVNKL
jgi:hypothetical protein